MKSRYVICKKSAWTCRNTNSSQRNYYVQTAQGLLYLLYIYSRGFIYLFLFFMNFNQDFKHLSSGRPKQGFPLIRRHSPRFFLLHFFPLGNFLLIGSASLGLSVVSRSISLSVSADERIRARWLRGAGCHFDVFGQ